MDYPQWNGHFWAIKTKKNNLAQMQIKDKESYGYFLHCSISLVYVKQPLRIL